MDISTIWDVPFAASETLRLISAVVAVCSSTLAILTVPDGDGPVVASREESQAIRRERD